MKVNAKPTVVDKLCSAIVRRPLWFMLAGLAIFLVCAAGMRLLKPDFTYRAFFGPEDPLRLQVEQFERTFSNDDSVVLIVHSPSGITDEDSSKLVVKLTEQMWAVPDVVRVDSLSNYSWVSASGDDINVQPMIPNSGLSTPALQAERRAAIAADPLIRDYLLSKDGKTTMVVGYVRADNDKPVEAAPIVEAVRRMVAANQQGDHVFHITGRMAIMAGLQEAAQADMKKMLPFVMLTIVVLLSVATRRPGGVLLPVMLVVISIITAMGFAGWMGLRISNITAMVPQFILAVGVAEAVHILASYYRLRRAGFVKQAAVELALRENFVPTVLTSSTTAIGFLSFMSTDIVAIDNLGRMVGFGVLCAWLFTYCLMGPVLAMLPELRLRKRDAGEAQPALTSADVVKAEETLKPWPWMLRYVALVRRVSLPIVALFVVASGAALYIASANTVNSNPFKYFSQDFWLRQSADFAETHLSGSQGMEIVIDAGRIDGIKDPKFLAQVEKLQTWVDAVPGVVKTVSVVDFIKQTNKSFNGDDPHHYVLPQDAAKVSELLFLYTMNLPKGLDLSNRVSVNNDKLRVSVRWTLYDSAAATQAAEQIEAKAKQMGLKAETTGKMLLFQRMNNYVSASQMQSIVVATLLISALMIAVYRSLTVGAVALITNLLPLCFGLAALTLMGRNIDTGAVVALSVCLGIVVDDTIHMLHAIRSRTVQSLEEAIAMAVRKVSSAVFFTTLILVIGFGAFMAGAFVPNQNFGLMAVVILGMGAVFELLFLPALLFLFSGVAAKPMADAVPDAGQPG